MTTNTQTLMGRYELLSEIGRGTMGVVYQARDPKIDRIVAVKTILLSDFDPTDGREYRERFYQEARSAGRLSHPGIVTIFDVGTNPENNNPYLVMEYVAGSSLDKLLLANKDGLPLGPALQLIQEIAEALDCAHSQGVIHRDIKPENILITTEGRAKIADFGIARMDQSQLTRVGQIMGSPAYMAPEQLTGEATDARSDLFSLGVVLYTVLTGHRPFQGNSTATVCFKLVHRDPIPVSAWSVDLPPELDQLLARALAKDPLQRFSTGAEMARELQCFREAHESQQPRLADVMRLIDRPPLLTQKLTVTAALSDSPEAESSDDPGLLHGVVEKVLQARVAEQTGITSAREGQSILPLAIVARAGSGTPKAVALAAAVAMAVVGIAVWSHRQHSKPTPPVIASSPAPVEAKPAQSVSEIIAEELNKPDASVENPKLDSAHAAEIAGHSRQKGTSHHALRKASTGAGQPQTDSPDDRADASPTDSPIAVSLISLANLEVVIDHAFEAGQAFISVDDRPVYTEELRGDKKRRALLFHYTQGRQSKGITLRPGKHTIMVRVRSAGSNYDMSNSLTEGFSPGSNRTLLVKCDEHKQKLELSVQ
jgi:serine/threonine-protein kinase